MTDKEYEREFTARILEQVYRYLDGDVDRDISPSDWVNDFALFLLQSGA